MAIAVVQGFACRSQLTFHRSLFHQLRQRQSSSIAASLIVEPMKDKEEEEEEVEAQLSTISNSLVKDNGECKPHEWKKLSSKDLGIRTSKITKPARLVLNVLRKNGYEVYLVGGCVRDLILKRTPKDFDIITSAELKEVLRTFPRCEIVGRRFPICHVHVDDTIVEVSSFSTSGRTSGSNFGRKSNYGFGRPPGCGEKELLRWRNCIRRDFTINGLMFDPFAKIVYDYVGGLDDIKMAKVRSVIPASTSFVEDCARILRGVRIAARLGFRFTRETAHYVKELSHSLLILDKGRIFMEMNYMLAYGSAEASLRLLWKFGLLEILLPIQASYFVSQGFRRRDRRYNMLLSLLSSLDKLLAPDQPCHCCLWVGILAFHKALVDQPQDPLAVAAFSIAVYSGGSLSKAIKVARKISQPHNRSFCELSEREGLDSDDALMDEIMNLAASVRAALHKMRDEHFVSQALIKYPQAPRSDLVFISLALLEKVGTIFDCVRRGKERGFILKRERIIDYESLAMGRIHEVRHVFARIVFDTVYPLKKKRMNETVSETSS